MAKNKKQNDISLNPDDITSEKSEPAEDLPAPNESEILEEALAAEKDNYVRLLAEYSNYKRRNEQEKEKSSLIAKTGLIKALLPAIDSLQLAASAISGDSEEAEGLRLVIRQFNDTLKAEGLEELNPLGEPFNPEYHNAIAREDAAAGEEKDVVSEVFQCGYKMGDVVIRPAMVKVSN